MLIPTVCSILYELYSKLKESMFLKMNSIWQYLSLNKNMFFSYFLFVYLKEKINEIFYVFCEWGAAISQIIYSTVEIWKIIKQEIKREMKKCFPNNYFFFKFKNKIGSNDTKEEILRWNSGMNY